MGGVLLALPPVHLKGSCLQLLAACRGKGLFWASSIPTGIWAGLQGPRTDLRLDLGQACQEEYEESLSILRAVTSAGSPSHKACFSQVRDSLPATLRQHMDEGRIQVDIINITNGSVVVEFNLLMTADLDVREVSAGFLSAFQNTSMLEVVRGKTIIQGMLGCAQC